VRWQLADENRTSSSTVPISAQIIGRFDEDDVGQLGAECIPGRPRAGSLARPNRGAAERPMATAEHIYGDPWREPGICPESTHADARRIAALIGHLTDARGACF